MKYLTKRIITAAGCLLMLTSVASAHPGQTDANGGHWDNSTGEYHYHHGYPAHQHTNGVCPYDYDDRTGWNSGTSGSSSRETVTSDTYEETSPESGTSENDETLYNDGLGDDGTYETAYNLGYQHGMEDLCQINSDVSVEIGVLASELCHTRALTGSTLYADKQSSYNDAYSDGYYQSETDLYTELNKAIEAYVSPQSEDTAPIETDSSLNEYGKKYEQGRKIGHTEGYNEAARTYDQYLLEAIGLAFVIIAVLFICSRRIINGHKYTMQKYQSIVDGISKQARQSPDKSISFEKIQQIIQKQQ